MANSTAKCNKISQHLQNMFIISELFLCGGIYCSILTVSGCCVWTDSKMEGPLRLPRELICLFLWAGLRLHDWKYDEIRLYDGFQIPVRRTTQSAAEASRHKDFSWKWRFWNGTLSCDQRKLKICERERRTVKTGGSEKSLIKWCSDWWIIFSYGWKNVEFRYKQWPRTGFWGNTTAKGSPFDSHRTYSAPTRASGKQRQGNTKLEKWKGRCKFPNLSYFKILSAYYTKHCRMGVCAQSAKMAARLVKTLCRILMA